MDTKCQPGRWYLPDFCKYSNADSIAQYMYGFSNLKPEKAKWYICNVNCLQMNYFAFPFSN